MDSFLACSECEEVVIKSVGAETKIRSKVLVVRDNTMYAVCKGCSSEIPVPLKLDSEMVKSISSQRQEPRLYLKK